MSEDDKEQRREKLAQKQKAFHEQERRRRGSVSKDGRRMKVSTTFIQKTSKEGLDKFIENALEEKRIDKVEVLDLSRHKISELSAKVRFYMRMLRQLRVLNLHANKLKVVPSEIGENYFMRISIGPSFSSFHIHAYTIHSFRGNGCCSNHRFERKPHYRHTTGSWKVAKPRDTWYTL